MPTLLTTTAEEKSTLIVTAAFADEDGGDVIPSSITWTLTDSAGIVINSREDVEVASPAASVDIVLSGDDLALQTGESGSVLRVLTVESIYDSGAGSDLPLKDSVKFLLNDLVAIS